MLFSLEDVDVVRTGTRILAGVSATLAQGRCTALIGPSGAGKSTLLRLLDRLEEPTSGRLLLAGKPLVSYEVRSLRRRVGFLQQQPVALAPTVLGDLRVGRPELTREEAAALLVRVGLGGVQPDRDRESLSGGEAQRCCLARALAVGPEVLLLDEPTAALDAGAATAVEEVLAGLVADGLTTVLVSHDLRQARRLADDVLVLAAGEVVEAGPAAEVFAAPRDPRARAFLADAA